ncbi:MAG: hypothetical protein ABR577_10810 [Pyrinomonadaceae bacterium]
MADPRNVAHDKKVMEEKKHDGEDLHEGTVHAPQPGMKPLMEEHESDNVDEKKDETEKE